MQKMFLFKIFYNEETRSQIEPDFLPLDNCDGPRDWFELWPILHYLEQNHLEDDTWYGFFSPKFPSKANVTLDEVKAVVFANPQADVALFSFNWRSIVSFRNAWIQGETFHPGLIDCFKQFLASRGESFDAQQIIGDFETTVYSNYVIAKKAYWLAWRDLARAYFNYVSAGGPALADNRPTRHSGQDSYILRTFVQERLSCWLLHRGGYRVVYPDYTRSVPKGWLAQTAKAPMLRTTLALAEFSKRMARRLNAPPLMIFHKVFMRLTGVIFRLHKLLGS